MEILKLIGLIIYVVLALSANEWIRYHWFGVRGEITSSVFVSFLSRLVWALVFGWITIPIWLICMFLKK